MQAILPNSAPDWMAHRAFKRFLHPYAPSSSKPVCYFGSSPIETSRQLTCSFSSSTYPKGLALETLEKDRIGSICSAIHSRRLVELEYDGGAVRMVEPHAVFQDQAGNTILLGWQREGSARSGRPQGWKHFRLSRVTSLLISLDSFDGPRLGYDPQSVVLAISWCKLE